MAQFNDVNDFLASLQKIRPKGNSSSSSSSAPAPATVINVDEWLRNEVDRSRRELQRRLSVQSSKDTADKISADEISMDEASEAEASADEASAGEASAGDEESVGTSDDSKPEPNTTTFNSQGRRSADDAWRSAHMEPVVSALDAVYQKCNKMCSLSGSCADGISGQEILRLRKAFHGENISKAPKDKDRAELIMKYIKAARRDKDDNLIFSVGGKDVCTPTFLRFIGVSSSADMRDAPRQWIRLIKGHLHGDSKENLLDAKNLSLDAGEGFSLKKVCALKAFNKY